MAAVTQVASCPHCDATLVVPTEALPDQAVRCPACQIAFQVDAQQVTELAIATLVGPMQQAPPSLAPQSLSPRSEAPAPTVDEPIDVPTDEPAANETIDEPAGGSLAEWLRNSTVDLTVDDETPGEPAVTPAEEQPTISADPAATEHADTVLSDRLLGDRLLSDRPASDLSPEVASISERTPVEESSVGEPPAEEAASEPAATIEFAPGILPDFGAKLSELSGEQAPTELPAERIELETARHVAGAAESAPLANDFAADYQSDAVAVEVDPVEKASAGDVAETSEPRRRRSWGVGRLATVAAGGVIGLALGYGMLLAVGDQAYDTLGLLAFVDSANDTPDESAADELASNDFMPGDSSASDFSASDFSDSGFSPASPADAEQATFEAPIEPDTRGPRNTPEQSAASSFVEPPPLIEPTGADALAPPEPARFAEPASEPAVELAAAAEENAAENLGVGIAGAPVYGSSELDAAMAGADVARADLAAHSLAEGIELELIGRSYAKLCEVAQVLTFLDKRSSDPQLTIHRLEAQDLYSQLFRYGHARADSRQVASRDPVLPGGGSSAADRLIVCPRTSAPGRLRIAWR
ncbi:MAG: hypothetical protein AAGF31_11865, partial [Planctomycetota bacterium]